MRLISRIAAALPIIFVATLVLPATRVRADTESIALESVRSVLEEHQAELGLIIDPKRDQRRQLQAIELALREIDTTDDGDFASEERTLRRIRKRVRRDFQDDERIQRILRRFALRLSDDLLLHIRAILKRLREDPDFVLRTKKRQRLIKRIERLRDKIDGARDDVLAGITVDAVAKRAQKTPTERLLRVIDVSGSRRLASLVDQLIIIGLPPAPAQPLQAGEYSEFGFQLELQDVVSRELESGLGSAYVRTSGAELQQLAIVQSVEIHVTAICYLKFAVLGDPGSGRLVGTHQADGSEQATATIRMFSGLGSAESGRELTGTVTIDAIDLEAGIVTGSALIELGAAGTTFQPVLVNSFSFSVERE